MFTEISVNVTVNLFFVRATGGLTDLGEYIGIDESIGRQRPRKESFSIIKYGDALEQLKEYNMDIF